MTAVTAPHRHPTPADPPDPAWYRHRMHAEFAAAETAELAYTRRVNRLNDKGAEVTDPILPLLASRIRDHRAWASTCAAVLTAECAYAQLPAPRKATT